MLLDEQTLHQLCRKWNRNITSSPKQGDDVPHGLGPLDSKLRGKTLGKRWVMMFMTFKTHQNQSKSGIRSKNHAYYVSKMFQCVCVYIFQWTELLCLGLTLYSKVEDDMLLFSTEDCELEAECLLGYGAECSVPQQEAARVHSEWKPPIRLNHARAPSAYCEFAQSAQSPSHGGLETCFSTAGTCSYAEWILSCSPTAFSFEPMCSHHECHPRRACFQ